MLQLEPMQRAVASDFSMLGGGGGGGGVEITVIMYRYISCIIIMCLQISTNGLLSFEEGFDSYIAAQFLSVPIIAPLWADFNFRDAGTIYYRVTTDDSILDAVVEYIGDRNKNYDEFRPTMAVVVTWFQSKVLRIEETVINA